MYIVSSVTEIGDDVFKGCDSLTGITVDENNANYASQDGILYNKAKTEFIHIPKAISGAISIPDGITGIGQNAFGNRLYVTKVTISVGTTFIGSWAFSGCSSLTNITFNGTMAQWDAITKGFYWNENTGKYTVHCTDGNLIKDN